jgi:glycerol uptake facilitator-like aquaporin
MDDHHLFCEALAELIGTALLLAAVVGSGIMAERLCGGNVGLELLANAVATGGALCALIVMFGPVSGAYWFTASTSFANPAVTIARLLSNTFAGIAPHDAPAFIAAQIVEAALAIAAGPLLEQRHARSYTSAGSSTYSGNHGPSGCRNF